MPFHPHDNTAEHDWIGRPTEIATDQVAFGLPFTMDHENALNVIRIYGEHVIPRFDPDPSTEARGVAKEPWPEPPLDVEETTMTAFPHPKDPARRQHRGERPLAA